MSCCKTIIDTIITLFWMFLDPFIRLGRCLCPRREKDIKGEIVLITGAGHGLGKEIAIRLAEFEPVLVLWDINQDNNEQLAAKLRSAGRTVFAYRVDVTDEQQVVQVANRVKREVGDVSMVINNAGVFSGQPFVNLPNHVIRRCFEVNSMAHFWVLQQFLPRMIELDRGHIVAVASMAGHHGVPNMIDYCASKHATVGMMESLYMELQSVRKRNIKLTTINPVMISTGFILNVKSRFPRLLPFLSAGKTADVVVKSILKEEEEVFIPARTRWLNNFTGCFSRRTRSRIMEYISYGFDPIVNKEPTKRGTEIV